MVETHRLTKYVVFILGNCTAGYMIVGKTCRECPVGTYQDKRWQTECIPCGNQMVTERKGATSSEECICECRVVTRPIVTSASWCQLDSLDGFHVGVIVT